MIKLHDSPEGKYNKFLDLDGDGHRGILLALSEDKTLGVVLALTNRNEDEAGNPMENNTTKGIVEYGKFYLIKETYSEMYPVVKEKVSEINIFLDILT